MELKSKDRTITGSVKLPDSWTGISLHFINNTTGQDLGTYANVVENMTAATPAFKIYNSRDDIYSDDELTADHNGSVDPMVTNQKVVFYKDTNDPKLLHFGTIFDDLGDVRVEIIKNGSVMGYNGVHLTADQDASDVITEVDSRINNINPPPIVDPTDITISGGGGGDGMGLLVAEEPGSLANPGAVDTSKSDPTQLVLPLHSGTALPTGTDHDLSLITLRRPTGLTSNSGTVTLTVSAPSSVALFNQAATHVLANYSVNLASPSGDLAGLATGNAQVWVRGAGTNSDVTLTYTYTDANGTVQQTDTVHLSVSATGAMIWPGIGMKAMPLFCGGNGIRGPPSIALNLMSLKLCSTVRQTAPTPAGPLNNRGLTYKSLLDYAEQGAWELPTAYVKGVIDGAWDGFKNDVSGIAALGDMALHPIARGSEIYQGLKALTQLTPSQLSQLGQNMVNSFVTGSENALPWTYQGTNPVDQAALNQYIQGYMTGYAGEQIGSCFIIVGTVSKVGKVLKAVVEASALGRQVLAGLNAAMQFRVKALQAITQFVNDTKAVRQAQRMVQRISDLQINGQSAATIIQNYLASVTDTTANWNTIAAAIKDYAIADMDGIGYSAYKRLAQAIAALGTNASEDAIMGFVRYYGSIVSASADYYDKLVQVFTDAGTFDAQGFKAVMEQFGTGTNHFFIRDGTVLTKWTSPAGLIYDTASAASDGHRILHVLMHTIPDGAGHSVFSVARKDLFATLDEAWRKGVSASPTDPLRFDIEMGRVVGTAGETKIRMIVDSTGRVTTAFPIQALSY